MAKQDKSTYTDLMDKVRENYLSIILGILAAFFGLLNYNCSIVCYSEYLSKRDLETFC